MRTLVNYKINVSLSCVEFPLFGDKFTCRNNCSVVCLYHDIFLIWPHGIDTLETFLENLSRTHPNISFIHEYSTTAVSFLDVIIKINNGIISASLCKKTLTTIAISITAAVILCT